MKDFATLYIVRHGESEGNVEGIAMGHHPSPLTEKGREQAMQTGEKLKHIHFDALYSSDIVRAQQTAEILAVERQLAVNTTELLRERFLGSWSGRKWKDIIEETRELVEKFSQLSDEEKLQFKFQEDLESDQEAITRFIRFVREIGVSHIGETILIVSHSGLMKSFLVHLGQLEYGDVFASGQIANGGFIKLTTDGVEFEVIETDGIILKSHIEA